MSTLKTIELDGVKYVRQDQIKSPIPMDGAVIVRTESAGVHYGVIEKSNGGEYTLTNSRRLWYWKGAASLSQLSVDGVKNPSECKFSVRVETITVIGVIEVIPCTEKAIACIEGVAEWKN